MSHLAALQAISKVQSVWLQEVLNSYSTDSHAQNLLTQLAINSSDAHGFSLHHGLIKYKGRVWIAHNSALQTKLIAAVHSSAIGGDLGVHATYY